MKIKFRNLGLRFHKPNFIYQDFLNENSRIIDVGCGFEADLSMLMIEKYGLTAFGVDPTKKHAPFLKELEAQSKGRFHHLPYAVSKDNQTLSFFESKENESGSILNEHTNIKNDEIIMYDVESLSLKELVKKTGSTSVDLLKLDIEGAEYELLKNVSKEDVAPFKQIFIEFHHHCTDYSIKETEKIVQHLSEKNFKVFTRDNHNYLFFR